MPRTSAVPIPVLPGRSSAQPVLDAAGGSGRALSQHLLCHTPALGQGWGSAEPEQSWGRRVQPQITELFTGFLAGMDKLGVEEAPPGTGAGMVQNKEIWAGVFGKGVQVLPTPGSCKPWGAAAP